MGQRAVQGRAGAPARVVAVRSSRAAGAGAVARTGGRGARPVRVAGTVAVLLLGGALLAGCGEDSGGLTGGDPQVVLGDLEGREFTSTQVRGHDLVEGTHVWLAFDTDHVSASAGCNTMFGEASFDEGRLVLPEEGLATTLMACPGDQEAQDEWLRGLLASEPLFELDGDRLEVGDDTDGISLQED